MGIRISTGLVHGVAFNKAEVKKIDSYLEQLKERAHGHVLRLACEELESWNNDTYSFFVHKCYIRNKKGRNGLFWKRYSKKRIKDLEENFLNQVNENIKKYTSDPHEQEYLTFMFPEVRPECNIGNILGFVSDKRYSADFDWGLASHFGFEGKNGIIKVKTTLPWETGIMKSDSKIWSTCNGENLIPSKDRLNLLEEEQRILFGPFHGSKAEFIKQRKALYYKYTNGKIHYRVSYGDGWFGSFYQFSFADAMYTVICKEVGLKYNFERLDKYLCFWWG